MIAYTVICTFDDPAVADEWIQWLLDEHLAEVRAGGATHAQIVRHDGAPIRCEVRYRFATRADFETYEREHAPKLRAAGLDRFPLDRGLAYERTVGEIIGGE